MASTTVLHEDVVTLANTSVVALFGSETLCLWAEVLQHPDYGDVKISTGGTPTVIREVGLDFVSIDWLHNLAEINVQAANNGDKVVVRYETLS